jgi:GNAT superfamily N-acetyltransferase
LKSADPFVSFAKDKNQMNFENILTLDPSLRVQPKGLDVRPKAVRLGMKCGPRLKEIYIKNSFPYMTWKDWKMLLGYFELCRNLQKFTLSHCTFLKNNFERALDLFKVLQTIPSLTFIDVSFNDIEEQGGTSFGGNPFGTLIRNSDLIHREFLLSYVPPNLQYLDIRGNKFKTLTAELARLPNFQIMHHGINTFSGKNNFRWSPEIYEMIQKNSNDQFHRFLQARFHVEVTPKLSYSIEVEMFDDTGFIFTFWSDASRKTFVGEISILFFQGGGGTFPLQNENEFYLEHVNVDSAFQGKNLGKVLICLAAKELDSKGNIFLLAQDKNFKETMTREQRENLHLIKYYRSLGFQCLFAKHWPGKAQFPFIEFDAKKEPRFLSASFDCQPMVTTIQSLTHFCDADDVINLKK